MRGSYYRSTVDGDARSKSKAKNPSLGTTTQIEISNDSDSAEDESSSSSGETLPKAIYPLHVARSRKAQTQSTIDPTQLTRAMSNLAINRGNVPEDVIEISD